MNEFLSEEKIHNYKEAFYSYDKDGDGLINISDLTLLLKKLNISLNKKELINFLSSTDEEEKKINFDEFLELVAEKSKELEVVQKIIEAFQIFDSDNKGFFTKKELKNILVNFGDKINSQDIKNIMNDIPENGNFFYNEFSKGFYQKLKTYKK